MKCFLLIFLLISAFGELSGRSVHRAKKRQVDECEALNATPEECSAYWAGEKPPLLVVSLDGFRPDYLQRNVTVNGVEEPAALLLNRLSRCGVFSPTGMTPVFPSLTFPNHYSIVTGLYPESHGIVANSFYDPDLNASFSLSSPQQTNPTWWIGDPLWYNVKRQGKISATCFWPGSDQTDPVRAPNYWLQYDDTVTYSERMRLVFDWLILPVSQRPNFVTVYLDEPDHTGHGESPDSPLVADQVRIVDQELQALFDNMEQVGILGCVDVIVLADHGMAPSPPGEKFLIMNDYVPNILNDARIYDGVFSTIRPKLDTEEEHDRIAGGLQCQDDNMRVYNKWDFPRRHHYANTNRIPNILVDMTVSWRAYAKSEWILRGNHGWDNLNNEMQAMFVAHGPSFKKNLQVRPFHNIDLYNLMCAMMEVDPSPNNGTWGALHHMLVSPPADPSPEPLTPISKLPFPADEATYNEHLMRKTCSLLTGSNTQSIDSTLNLTESATNAALQMHTPWGTPQTKDTTQIKTVISTDYVTAFDVVSGLPSWTSFTINQPRLTTAQPQWRLDVRLEETHASICDRFPDGIDSTWSVVPLFPFDTPSNSADVAVDTNAIEISKPFETYWNEFHAMLNRSVETNGETNVIVGPVRDSPSPGLFFVVSTCRSNGVALADCPVDQLDMQSFIMPTNVRYSRDCIKFTAFFNAHLASLPDVEHLTGIRFFPALPYGDKADILSRTPLASTLLVNPDPSTL
ncbi:hypothetical protein GHT06_017762 [Daphnia sinensis]|uniref:ENPP1-3/EXOG-like endonuclease/phosphodiesterase domain-containing protein n=1 Tax=Daphnia sinensis TaxID=1820382 RepID=A0AAD5KMR3_9CRUS|nr:hypothetical protein GHT06_017762 [Daphnia sinensis]